jgi:hypothetical protein
MAGGDRRASRLERGLMADRRRENNEREAEAFIERFTDDAFRADPDAIPDLIAILAAEDAPEHIQRHFAQGAIRAEVDWATARRDFRRVVRSGGGQSAG